MHSQSKIVGALASLATLGAAQLVGTSDAEVHPSLTWQKCTAPGSCTNVSGKVVIDANWRWTHNKGGYENCYDGNAWIDKYCPDSATCTSQCEIEGANYSGTYGVTTSGNALTLKYVNEHSFGKNIGSRLYLLANDEKYQMFTMNGNEIAFDVLNADLGCGLNGAVYFVSMDEDGGKARYSTNKAGAKYGTGYCDSQCARDLKWVGGQANVDGWAPSEQDANTGIGNKGACCPEMDLWEANAQSFALTPHPCQDQKYYVCDTDECGGTYSPDRYAGDCDADGCDLNPYRHKNTDFYGPGKTIDTTKKFTVVTQFHGSGTGLDSIKQYFIQNGVRFDVPDSQYVDGGSEITQEFCEASKELFGDSSKFFDVGGLSKMGEATGAPMVLVMSVWDDGFSHMKWLDGEKYPLERDPAEPGVPRGSCPTEGSEPEVVREKFKNAKVTYSNIKFGPIGSTYAL